MRCGQCGQRLTAAVVAMGQCPHCGNILDAKEDLAHFRPANATDESHHAQQLPSGQQAALLEPHIHQSLPPAPPLITSTGRGTPRSATMLENQHTASGYAPASGDALPPPQPLFNSSRHQPPSSQIIVDAEPMALPQQRVQSRNPFPGIVMAFTVLLALGSALVIAGQNNLGPLTGFLHPSGASTTIAMTTPTQLPTTAPTATTVPPTATPLPTATPVPAVPPPPIGYSTFISSDGRFGFNFLSTWHSNPTPPVNGVTANNFSAPFVTNEFVQVDEYTTTIDPNNIETYVTKYSQSSNGTNVLITAAASAYQIGANHWMHAEASYLGTDGTHKVFGLAINDGVNGYLFFYDAPASSYQTKSGSPFDEMVKSFTFLHS